MRTWRGAVCLLAALFLSVGFLVTTGPAGATPATKSKSHAGDSASVAVQQIYCIACDSATVCEAGGQDADGVILGTTGGTNNWKVQEHYSNGTLGVTGMACPSTTICEAVAQKPTGEPSTAVLMSTTNGGATWTSQIAPTNLYSVGSLGAIACVSISTCEVVGDSNTTDQGAIVRTTDGGKKWVNQPVPKEANGTPLNTSSLNGIACVSSLVCEAVGGSLTTPGVILRTTDGGKMWVSRPISGDVEGLNAIER